MQDYLYTPTHSQYYLNKDNDTTLTATHLYKSTTPYKSTQYGNASQHHSSSLAVSKLSQARNTIDEVIDEMNDKRNATREAIQQISRVNSEILDQYRRKGHSTHQYSSPHARPTPSRFKQSATTGYDLTETRQEQLEEERLRSSQLAMRLSQVEEENRRLRASGAGFRGDQTESLRAENTQLRQQILQFRNISTEVWAELDQLKQENQHLRRDTVELLRRNPC